MSIHPLFNKNGELTPEALKEAIETLKKICLNT